MENKKLDADECVKKWASDIRVDRSIQYLKSTRKSHLDDLMKYFIFNDVPQDDAEFTKNAVVKILVSPTGMTGSKKEHRTWKGNTEQDFDDAIQKFYVPGLVDTGFKKIETAQGYDPNIMAWIKKKYGEGVRKDFITACHQPGHQFWLMFIKDHFNRENL
jgi:hypothetical protein